MTDSRVTHAHPTLTTSQRSLGGATTTWSTPTTATRRFAQEGAAGACLLSQIMPSSHAYNGKNENFLAQRGKTLIYIFVRCKILSVHFYLNCCDNILHITVYIIEKYSIIECKLTSVRSVLSLLMRAISVINARSKDLLRNVFTYVYVRISKPISVQIS